MGPHAYPNRYTLGQHHGRHIKLKRDVEKRACPKRRQMQLPLPCACWHSACIDEYEKRFGLRRFDSQAIGVAKPGQWIGHQVFALCQDVIH